MRLIFKMTDNKNKVTVHASERDAIEVASKLVRAAGYPVDVREYANFTFVTADPRSGRDAQALPYFNIKAEAARS